MSIDWSRQAARWVQPQRQTLSGATMGTRYSAVFHAPPGLGLDEIGRALKAAVDDVDHQMSNWKEGSDLNRFNRAGVGTWVDIPDALCEVLKASLDIERRSGGAFNIAVGAAVNSWGFGPSPPPDLPRLEHRTSCPEPSRHLELASGRARKHMAMTLDLNGIAKGYGVDRMADVMCRFGLMSWLVGIDGEMRAKGRKPDGTAWAVGRERPDRQVREAMGVIELADMSVATSGNYRHWRLVDGAFISHTIAPCTGEPLRNTIASVTVLAPTCMAADAWATALTVLGLEEGMKRACLERLPVIFVSTDGRVYSSVDR